ncbi:MAG: RNA 2',3'-cyclic phosphodiesterase [Thermodesulfovibrionales bacterium]
MRTFIAINLSEEIKNTIGGFISKLSTLEPRERFAKTDTLHVTLKFLGEVHEEKVNGIYLSLCDVLKGFGGFQLSIRGMGVFPSIKSPRVVWIGIDKSREIVQLYNHVETVCEGFGFSKEKRDFSPHITIVRLKDRISRDFKEQILINSHSLWGVIDVKGVEVMKSILTPHGAEYEVFRRISLE